MNLASVKTLAVPERDYALDRPHNRLNLLHLPAERRESKPVDIPMQSKQEAAVLRAWQFTFLVEPFAYFLLQ
jgi:hypothetical protein